jgi:hypothetical protein
MVIGHGGARAVSGKHKPYVNITPEGPEDGGDFGPYTPGTRTSGIQEALDYAHEHCRDVYIFGGRGGIHDGKLVEPGNVYELHETLRVPWSQFVKLDGGNYVLYYAQPTGDAVVIDSQMNCRYKFGLIVSNSDGAAVRIKPTTSGPDDFTVVTASVFDFSAICCFNASGTGLVLDSSQGIISNNYLFAEETNTQKMGVHISDHGGTGHPIANNNITVMFGNQMHSRGDCTGLRLGDPGSKRIFGNRFEGSFHAPRGVYLDEETGRYVTPEAFVPENAIGADVFAQRNELHLSFYGVREEGHDILFEPDSRDNTIYAMNLPSGVTNRAEYPTNRIVPNWSVGFGLPTPDLPESGRPIVNRNPYTTEILILDPGEVTDWTLTDAGSMPQRLSRNLSLADSLNRPPMEPLPDRAPVSHTVQGGLAAGQSITLEPGDSITLTYAVAPEWAWRALR